MTGEESLTQSVFLKRSRTAKGKSKGSIFVAPGGLSWPGSEPQNGLSEWTGLSSQGWSLGGGMGFAEGLG